MDPQSSECQRTFQPLATEVKIRCRMHQQYINIPSRHIPAPVQPRHGRSRCSWCWGYPYTFVWWRDVSRVEIMFLWLWPLIQSIDAQSSRKSECFSLSCTVMWNHAVVSLQSVGVLIALRTSSDTIFQVLLACPFDLTVLSDARWACRIPGMNILCPEARRRDQKWPKSVPWVSEGLMSQLFEERVSHPLVTMVWKIIPPTVRQDGKDQVPEALHLGYHQLGTNSS